MSSDQCRRSSVDHQADFDIGTWIMKMSPFWTAWRRESHENVRTAAAAGSCRGTSNILFYWYFPDIFLNSLRSLMGIITYDNLYVVMDADFIPKALPSR